MPSTAKDFLHYSCIESATLDSIIKRSVYWWHGEKLLKLGNM